ncbi:protein Turandot A-like [Drosophila ficusphila]|uniref:protein Turandot A-like n=1 Tax=Drosophila ficusphila TaxID=30025 RepID=UPI001C8A2F81|nr:protein Turandot A-like [Drosophila ficusphila]
MVRKSRSISSVFSSIPTSSRKMKSSISLMCFALLLISPLCFGYSDEEREADRLKVAEIMTTSLDDETKINRTQELLDIYYRLAPSLPSEEREKIDVFVNANTDAILIDGVPSQGGRKSKIASKIATKAAKDAATGFFEELGSTLARKLNEWFG